MRLTDEALFLQDRVTGLLEAHLANTSNRLNQVMKVLTVIATIFMPLTFIAGIYGMNFDFMPELTWTFGYPLIMIFMILVCVLIYLWFKRKGWM